MRIFLNVDHLQLSPFFQYFLWSAFANPHQKGKVLYGWFLRRFQFIYFTIVSYVSSYSSTLSTIFTEIISKKFKFHYTILSYILIEWLRYRKTIEIFKFNQVKIKIFINSENDRSVDKFERYFPDDNFIAGHLLFAYS